LQVPLPEIGKGLHPQRPEGLGVGLLALHHQPDGDGHHQHRREDRGGGPQALAALTPSPLGGAEPAPLLRLWP